MFRLGLGSLRSPSFRYSGIGKHSHLVPPCSSRGPVSSLHTCRNSCNKCPKLAPSSCPLRGLPPPTSPPPPDTAAPVLVSVSVSVSVPVSTSAAALLCCSARISTQSSFALSSSSCLACSTSTSPACPRSLLPSVPPPSSTPAMPPPARRSSAACSCETGERHVRCCYRRADTGHFGGGKRSDTRLHACALQRIGQQQLGNMHALELTSESPRRQRANRSLSAPPPLFNRKHMIEKYPGVVRNAVPHLPLDLNLRSRTSQKAAHVTTTADTADACGHA